MGFEPTFTLLRANSNPLCTLLGGKQAVVGFKRELVTLITDLITDYSLISEAINPYEQNNN